LPFSSLVLSKISIFVISPLTSSGVSSFKSVHLRIMERNARRQKYCNGIAPYEYNGEKMTCRQYAVIMGKKEKVEAHPILSIHKKRCNCIRAELSKGTITKEFATMSKEIADELKTLAIHGDGYTAEQFKRDMTREALYALTYKRLK
jgi:hypothetical protein